MSCRANIFWEARDLPVFCNVLCATREEALAVPRGDIRLAYAPKTGLITNVAFDPQRMAYGAQYENSLHFSPRFQAYADELVVGLVARHDLRGKTVLEIACGQGDFLKALCEAAGARGVGFDPAHDPADAACSPSVEYIQDYYGSAYADRRADLICCRHALEHILDPVRFLQELRRTVGDRPETVVFFEVPNGLYTLREMGIWDLIYEHCTYFVPDSLRRCFELAGFEVLEVREVYEGQFLTLEARPAAGVAAVSATEGDLPQVARDVAAFSAAYAEKVAEWRQRLADLRSAGRSAVVWGSGSKGVTFLNILQPGETVPHVVDINPRKQGRYVAGTGQAIVAPEALRTLQPSVVVVMNGIYRNEIGATLQGLGLSPEVLLA